MKTKNLKLLALFVSILIVISSLSILTSAAQPSSYSKTSNSGTRDEVCTSLAGTSAYTYYTGSYTYDQLIELSSSALKSSLRNLMKNTHNKITSYNDCRDYVWQTDCENNDTSHATTLYTSKSMTSSDWSPSWKCNREHVWPQSKGGNNTSGGGADLHHIRPAEASVNSSRGNKAYGESSGYYEPQDHVKGDVARIILYVYVRWDSDWGATNLSSVFESVDILLEWCELDPVDTWEMGRNEVIQNIQGNRNVFIDYPELAWQMLGKAVPDDMVTPSGAAINGEVAPPPAGGDNNDNNDSSDDNSSTPSAPAEIPEYLVLKNDGKYVTSTAYTYTSSSGSTKNQLTLSSNKSDAMTLQVINNSDSTVTLKADNKYLYADGTHVKLVDSEGDNTKFVFEQNGSGYFVKCANATYNGNAQYLEIYKGYLTCYGMGTDASVYTFILEAADSSSGDSGSDDVQKPEDTTQKPGDNPTISEGLVAEFTFGANGDASHNDGTDASSSKVFIADNYTLSLTELSKVYVDARDAQGNSCLKVGTSSVVGSLSFTVDSNIEKVIIHIAQYKEKKTTVEINGTQYSINTASNNGEYTAITVDTSSVKTVTLTTVSGATRCMINTIELWAAERTPEDDGPQIEEGTTGSESESTELETNESSTTESNTPGSELESNTTEHGTTAVGNGETNSTEIESENEISTDVKSETDNTESDTAEAKTDKSSSGGCGSSITGGAIIISVLCLGSMAICGKKKED